MKLRSFFYGLGAAVAILLLIGASGFFWITSQSPLKLLADGKDKVPMASIFVPRQAPAMVSLLVNPSDLESFRQAVVAPQDRRQARAEFNQLKQSLLANTGLSYEADVQPWLGDEITLALTTLDMDRDRANGTQPGYLLAIATKDPDRSREFLQLFWQKRAISGNDLVFEQYKGVKIIYVEVPPSQRPEEVKAKKGKNKSGLLSAENFFSPSTLASAVVGNQFVLFANDPKVLRDAITNVQAGELNLSQASFYTKSLETLNQPRIGVSFINVPAFANWLETETATPTKESTSAKGKETESANLVASGQYQTIAIALELARDGLVADTAVIALNRKGEKSAPTLSQPVEALKYLPANTPLVASGTNLKQQWQALSESLSDYKAVSTLINQPIQNLQTRWKLNLPKDIFSWVQDDYALAVLPDQDGNLPTEKNTKKKGKKATELSVNDWIFVAERGTQDATKAEIAHLDDIAKQQGYSVGSVQIGDQPVSAWTRLSAKQNASNTLQATVEGVHTTVGNYELFASSIAAMEQALAAVDQSFINSDRFQDAIHPLLQPNSGYLYLDWKAGRTALEQRFPVLKVIELAGKPFFSHLESLTLSSYGNQAGVQRGGLFMKLS